MGADEHGSTTIDKNDEITAYEFGVNYYLKKHDAKVQLTGSFFEPRAEGGQDHVRSDPGKPGRVLGRRCCVASEVPAPWTGTRRN